MQAKTRGEVAAHVALMSSIFGAAERQFASMNLNLFGMEAAREKEDLLLGVGFSSKKLVSKVEMVNFIAIYCEFALLQKNP